MERDSVLDGAFDAIVTMDTAGVIIEMNTAAERMFRCTRADAIGRELAALFIPPEFRDEHRRALALQPHDGPSRIIGQRLELDAIRSDRTRFPIELSVSRIDAPGGIFFTAWIRDLSERRAGRGGAAPQRGPAAAGAEDGSGGPARRRRRPRLQQRAHRDLRLRRPGPRRHGSGRSPPPRHRRDQARRQSRRRPHAPAARVQPQAGDAAAPDRPQRDHRRTSRRCSSSSSARRSCC